MINFFNPKKQAVLDLVIASSLWGFGFVATIWALDSFTPAGLLGIRFLIAFIVGEALRVLFIQRKSFHRRPFYQKKEFQLSFFTGIFLGLLLVFQAIGLETTTATKSSFITCLYVILVPIVGTLFFKISIPKITWASVSLALFGTYLLTGADFSSINSGDWITLIAAGIAAVHFLLVGKYSTAIDDSFRYNNIQSLASFLCTAPLFLYKGVFKVPVSVALADHRALWSILFLAIASSLYGFMLQIKSQRQLDESTAALLALLESPFAAFFAILFLHEKLGPIQLTGAILILVASALQISWPSLKSRYLKLLQVSCK